MTDYAIFCYLLVSNIKIIQLDQKQLSCLSIQCYFRFIYKCVYLFDRHFYFYLDSINLSDDDFSICYFSKVHLIY